MENDKPSTTAYLAAVIRAWHQILDHPLIFEDPLALKIIGKNAEEKMRANSGKRNRKRMRGLRAMLAVRSRIAEDLLHDAVARGVRQYVILGAGLDTFAYRNPYAVDRLMVYEVDHPATQAWKRKLLAAAGIDCPASMAFVPVDFESDKMAEQLKKAGVTGAAAVFAWLGVTMYLQPATVMNTLSDIARLHAPGTTIVFDYVPDDSALGIMQRMLRRMQQVRYGRLGEPWVGFFNPERLSAELKKLGYADIRDLGPAEIGDTYLSNRKDSLKLNRIGLRLFGVGRVMIARL
jgi:methyltransferase (TIGR00027 family)